MNKELLTIDELSELLRVRRGWIYSRTRERSPNTIPFIKLGKYLRFDPDEVFAWLETQRRGWRQIE
ncbi:MAG: helix-turn-helix domain-containing protein [candidate division Zixibacteria bacterium]|nr:helix-turn-helix domain-containing protein [candidate division Zixibacteria bacterium]